MPQALAILFYCGKKRGGPVGGKEKKTRYLHQAFAILIKFEKTGAGGRRVKGKKG